MERVDNRTGTFILIGIAFWLIGVVLIRLLVPIMTESLGLHILFLALCFLSSPLALIFIAKLTGRTKHDMLVPLAIMTMPSMVMDSLAVTADARGMTHIYADSASHAAYSGAGLLMAFWGLYLFALLWHRP